MNKAVLTVITVALLGSFQLSASAATQNHVQSVKSSYKGFGVVVYRFGDVVKVDGKLAALDEVAESGKVYSQGLYQVIFYNSGKVALLKNHVVLGFLK